MDERNMSDWIDVDIGDEVTMPFGLIVEKRNHNGRTQFRNPIIKPVCNIAYLALFPNSKPQEQHRCPESPHQLMN